MMPARPSGFFSSATSSRSGVELEHLAVQQRQRLAGAREAHDDVAVEQAVVVGVQRLAELEHHVVGDVDDGRDRADAAALEALLHPRRRRRARRRCRRSTRAAKARARQRRPRRERRACALTVDGRRRASGGSVSGAPVMAATSRAMPSERQAIGAIGRELEREQRVVERRAPRADRRRSAHRRVEQQQARRVVGRCRARLAEHSMPCDSTPRIVARLIARPPGSAAPTSAHGAVMPAAAFGAPQTICSGAPAPASTRAHAQAVGVRMRRDAIDRADDDAGERRRGRPRRPRPRGRPSSARRTAPSLSSGGSTSVRSQRSENFIVRRRQANCRRKRRSFS